MSIFSRCVKISPTISESRCVKESRPITIDSRVIINDKDDDMHGHTGIFKGHFITRHNEYRSLIALDEKNDTIYVDSRIVFPFDEN